MKNFLWFLCLIGAPVAMAQVKTYPAPDGAQRSDAFAVEVRPAGGTWQSVDVYKVFVDEVVDTRHTVKDSSMAYFDFDGEVEVRVTGNEPEIHTARVRPASYGIEPTVEGHTLTFTLDRPRNLSVEVNGEIFNNLQLFANPIEHDAPDPKRIKQLQKEGKLCYFGPGYHRIDTLRVQSGQWLYVAGGAVLDGVVEVADARDVRISGRGMIYPERAMGVLVARSRNVEVEGIFTTQCAVGGCDSVEVKNVKVMSYYGWGDGFNVFASSNVHYDGIFARTSDDCTTIYATRKGFTGDSRNILTENAVLWADVAHPFMIGIHGNVDDPDTIEQIVYRNIDILDMQEKQIDYQGVFAIVAGDENLVRDVLFDDIRVENFRQGKLFDLRVVWNRKYCRAPGRGIEDITFRNIRYDGDRSELSLLIGYDGQRKVRNVRFENLRINGVHICDTMPGKPAWYKTGDMARIFVGEHVENVTFE